jgi:raffinose/stachyose/melibiose transport system permease protein
MILDLRFKSEKISKKILYLLFELILIGYTLAVLYPVFNLFMSSFKTTREIFTNPFSFPEVWRFENYVAVWQRGGFGNYFLNSIFITAIAILLVVLFGSMAANGIARYSYKTKMLVYLLFLSGIVLPLKAAIIPLFLLIERLGLTDTRVSLILIFTAMGIPSTVFILSGFMKTIPKELEYAARIDGCNDFTIYRIIVMPLSMSSITLVTIYNLVPIWNDFFFPLIFISTDGKKTLPLGVASFFGQYQIQWDLIFAALSIAVVPMIVVYAFMSKYFIKGMTAGALKG